MGHGDWKKNYYLLPITPTLEPVPHRDGNRARRGLDSPLPIPNAQYPLTTIN
ncbi:hypothetical protein [Tolypothrix sp. NIES-4075]|uniref:hypothetical protein n=1 Tax=Tolypothrix sp. NIES-4075 TaxID=2005459 RepID=UPI00135BEEEA|nr:hypothetical protein [Tolypothrix sp. NIES-4075]